MCYKSINKTVTAQIGMNFGAQDIWRENFYAFSQNINVKNVSAVFFKKHYFILPKNLTKKMENSWCFGPYLIKMAMMAGI